MLHPVHFYLKTTDSEAILLSAILKHLHTEHIATDIKIRFSIIKLG